MHDPKERIGVHGVLLVHLPKKEIIPLSIHKMNAFVNFAKKVWGTDSSRGFRAASWGMAFAAFGVWYYIDNRPVLVNHGTASKEGK